MPIDTRKDPRLVAVVFADVIGSKAIAEHSRLARSLRETAGHLNRTFKPALAEPFAPAAGDEIQGSLSDPAQAPLCVAVLREALAPIKSRVAVSIGAVEARPPGEMLRDPYAEAHDMLGTLKRTDGLTAYVGAGPAADILFNAICRLVDPLVRARSDKQWEAIAAYRRLGHQRAVAEELGVTRQSVGDRMAAGHWRAVEDADAAVAAFLTYIRSASA
jgi:hypothetical protein